MRRLLISLFSLLALLAAPAVAAAPVNVPAKFSSVLGQVRSKSGLKVRLPSRLDAGVRPSRVRGAVESVRRGHYHLSLGVGRGCHESTACYVASFFGGGQVSGGKRVSLARGLTGRFSPMSCGASCGPASVSWRQGGVAYTVQFKGRKSALVALADSAIRGGAR